MKKIQYLYGTVKNYLSLLWVFTNLHFSSCSLNTNTAITRKLIRTARTLEAEWRQVCGEAWLRGVKEDEASTGRVWAAGFHHVMASSRVARVFRLMNRSLL